MSYRKHSVDVFSTSKQLHKRLNVRLIKTNSKNVFLFIVNLNFYQFSPGDQKQTRIIIASDFLVFVFFKFTMETLDFNVLEAREPNMGESECMCG